MGSRFLTLSLFIMMLSFFIVLNSFSSFESTKSKNLMQSVKETFSSNPPGDTFVPELKGGGGDVSSNPLDRLDSAFQGEGTSDAQAKSNRLKTAMRVRLTLDKFEGMITGNDNAMPGGGSLLPVLASVFDQDSGPSYRMQMVLNIAANPSEFYARNPQGASAAIAKSASLMQGLQDAGLPADSMTAGIGQGPENTVDLIFYRKSG